jgi:acylphosphatase
MKNIIHYNITVKGKVQGVWFRKYTLNKALEMGVNGWVKNTPEGYVYIEAEANREILQEFLEVIKIGSPRSQVAEVEVIPSDVKNYIGFQIIYS